MMDTKLTLKLNQEIIERAKKYASNQKLSLSRIVEAYLQTLTSDKKNSDFEISPFVKSMATGTKIPADLDSKKEYSDHLMEKYK
jgi:replicative DNA helicase